jgi:hypothetical protein
MDLVNLTQYERDRLAALGVLEAVERLGTVAVVKLPGKVLPWAEASTAARARLRLH